MATDAQTPTGPPDRVRTRQLFTGPNHAAREAVVSADAATGRECEVPSLVIISGRHRGRRIPVPSTGIVLGREGRLAPFFRDDPLASRGHAQVYVADDRSVQVADLNSTNGTFVNGEAISSLTRLAGQDVLRIGSIEMRLDRREPALSQQMRVSDCMTSAPAGQIPRPGGGPRQSIGARRAARAFFRLPRGRMLRPGLAAARQKPGLARSGPRPGSHRGPADQAAPPSSSTHNCETPHAVTRRGRWWLPAASTRLEWHRASFWTECGQSALR